MSVLEVRDLHKRFDRITAVDGVSFTLKAGEALGLVGGNGAGKTTLIGMILGLITPSRGEVRMLNCRMTKSERTRALARINFQSPYVDLPKRLTLRENLSVYARLYGVRDTSAAIDAAVALTKTAHLLDRAYGTLSAGQRTCASLAKALLNEPEILFLDEPTASLDPQTAIRIRSAIEDYRKTTGAALFMASHNMDEVERLCGTVLVMRAGRIIERDAPARLMERYGRAKLEDVFLDIAEKAPLSDAG